MKKLILSMAVLAVSLYSDAQTITGGDMETWLTYTSAGTSMQRPDGWSSSDSLVRAILKLTAPSGTYTPRVNPSTVVFRSGLSAALLESSATDTFPTFITNANISVNIFTMSYVFSGGTPVSSRINFVNAWTQFSHSSLSDTGRMLVYATKLGAGAGGKDSIVGQGSADITFSAGFVERSAWIDYVDATVVPDRIIVAFQTSRLDSRPAGTVLYVDDVTISDPTGVKQALLQTAAVQVFPNPALNVLHVKTNVSHSIIDVYDIRGAHVLQQELNTSEATIHLGQFLSGSYLYTLSNTENGPKISAGHFIKQ